MSRRIQSSEFVFVLLFWSTDILGGFLSIGALYGLSIALILLFRESTILFNVSAFLVSLAFFAAAAISLRIGPLVLVRSLQSTLPPMVGKQGARLANQWSLILVAAALASDALTPLRYGRDTVSIVKWPVLILSLPACALLTALAIRRACIPLPKKELAVLPSLFLAAELPALAVHVQVASLLVDMKEQLIHYVFSWQTGASPLILALNLAPILIYYGIGGAIGSVLMLLRLNRTIAVV